MASRVALYTRDTTEPPVPPDALPVRVGSEAQGLSVQITCIVFMSLSWITVLFRFYTRGVLVRNIGADDWCVLSSAVFFTIYNIACIICAGATMGDVYLRVGSAGTAFNWLLVAESFYVVTMCALKFSVAIFFLRVMVKPWQRNVVYASVALATVMNIVYFFVIVFQCGTPHGGMWFLLQQLAQKCLTRSQFLGVSYTHGVVSSVTDIVFAVLPVVILRSSRLHSREKATVLLILSLAAIGGVASMVRLNYVSRLAVATQSWFVDANLIAIWSAVEPGLGIIATSLATMRPLFRNCLFNVRTTRGSSEQYHDSRHYPAAKSFSTAEHPLSRNEELAFTLSDELPPLKEELTLADFKFVDGDFPLRSNPVQRQHIEKQPWRPVVDSPVYEPDTAKMQNQRSLEKAQEFLGEVLSRGPSPRYGNMVRCEGPLDEHPEPSRYGSSYRLRGVYKT